MMKNKKPFLIFNSFMLLLSIIYMIAFQFKLKELGAYLYNSTYNLIELLVALPVFCFSLSFLLIALIQNRAGKPISRKVRISCVSASVIWVIVYFILIMLQLFTSCLSVNSYMFFASYQVIHIIPGALLALGATRN